MAATNSRGVFSLEKVIERQDSNNWSDISNVFAYVKGVPLGSGYGYSLGGYYPASGPGNGSTIVQRIDLTNDTATGATRGNLSSQRSGHGAASSLTAMYTGNGQNYGVTPSSSIVDRLDYASDTGTASPKGNLPVSRYATSGVSNTDYGFWIGGTPSPAKTFRTDWSNDTSTPIESAEWYSGAGSPYFGAAAGNLSYGYAFAGSGGGSHTGRIDYSNHTATMLEKGKGTYASYGIAGTGNANYGYYAGGSGPKSNVSRLDYANDSAAATPKGPLDTAKLCAGATATSDYGYWIGGADGGWTTPGTTSSQRLDFANDTTTTSPKGPLAAGVSYNAGTSTKAFGFPTTTGDQASGSIADSVGPAYGYWAGGTRPAANGDTIVDRLDYSNDTSIGSQRGNLYDYTSSYNNSGTGNTNYGYTGTGYSFNPASPGKRTYLSRVDYSNDTATSLQRGAFYLQKYYAGAMANSDYGYWAGGDPSPRSSMQRFDWANDTATSTLKSNFSGNRYHLGATGTPSFAYFAAGQTPSASSMVERFDMSNDDLAPVQKGSLTRTISYCSATGSPSYGYFAGGYNLPAPTQVDRVDYSNDTAQASPRGNLSTQMNYAAATGSRDYGYYSGGKDPFPGAVMSTVERIDYSNDSAASSPKGPLANALTNRGSTFSSRANALQGLPRRFRFYDNVPAPRGYFAGGFNNNTDGNPWYYYSTVERYNFDNDTSTAQPKANLPFTGSIDLAGIATPDFSYFMAGTISARPYPLSYLSYAERLDHSNDTLVRRGSMNPTRRVSVTGNSNYGYLSGDIYPGDPSSYTRLTSIIRFDFSNDDTYHSPTAAISAVSPPTVRAAVSSPAYGYYGGGYISSSSSTFVERIDFSNDTANLVAKGSLSEARQSLGATGTSAYGYFAGGNFNPGGTYRTTVDRLDYSNDTADLVAKGPLTFVKKEFGASSSDSYAYFGGGYNIVPGGNNYLSSTDRLDFSNDTATTVAKGNLSRSRNRIGATSASVTAVAPVQPPFSVPTEAYNPATSKQHGYWACGLNRDPMPSTIAFSSVDRLDFSNDTTAASPKGNATFAMSSLQSVANASYGYITGGYTDHPPSGRQSSINRLDYANDTAALTVTGSTPSDVNPEGIYLGWGVGNASYGYWGGNYPGSSRIFRLDYSNDTSAPIITGKYFNSSYADAAGNQSYGWIAGKSPSGSRVERLDYSNDSNNTVTKGPLTSNRYDGGAASNSSYGWFGGGKNGSPGFSNVDRIDFANDTPTASPKGNLTNAVALLAATGDPNYGYFGGSGPAFSAKSYMQRIDYASDTSTASPKGPLSVPRSASTAFSAAANAMP